MTGERDDFFERVYRVVEGIPTGRVTTYGAVARHLGIGSAARMVGFALNRLSGSEIELPAHRVVNRFGELSGRRWFPDDSMRERLEQEGITFVDEFTVDLKRHFWSPEGSIPDPDQPE